MCTTGRQEPCAPTVSTPDPGPKPSLPRVPVDLQALFVESAKSITVEEPVVAPSHDPAFTSPVPTRKPSVSRVPLDLQTLFVESAKRVTVEEPVVPPSHDPAFTSPVPTRKPSVSRVPLDLQTLFVDSSRGFTIEEPPVSASKVFPSRWRSIGRAAKSDRRVTPPLSPSPPARTRSLPLPAISPSRIPLDLQKVFLDSSRGDTVEQPPPTASKVFSGRWSATARTQRRSGPAPTLSPLSSPTATGRPRVPLDLQNVFIAASRGSTIDMPPPSASRIFPGHRWFAGSVVRRKRFMQKEATVSLESPCKGRSPAKPIMRARLRIPLPLQTVFLAASRGRNVRKPPDCANQVFPREKVPLKRRRGPRLFFGRDNLFVFDKKGPTTQPADAFTEFDGAEVVIEFEDDDSVDSVCSETQSSVHSQRSSKDPPKCPVRAADVPAMKNHDVDQSEKRSEETCAGGCLVPPKCLVRTTGVSFVETAHSDDNSESYDSEDDSSDSDYSEEDHSESCHSDSDNSDSSDYSEIDSSGSSADVNFEEPFTCPVQIRGQSLAKDTSVAGEGSRDKAVGLPATAKSALPPKLPARSSSIELSIPLPLEGNS